MGGLIPLLLPSSTTGRPSVPEKQAEMKRPASVMATQGLMASNHRRNQSLPLMKATKRLTISASAASPTMPTTPEEWRKTIKDVKRKYGSRKYRTCSARCCEILDNLKDESSVETLHLVYLHFYAASSFEMCARPLSHSSAYRTKLLDDARDNYDKASVLIKKVEDEAIERTRSPSSISVRTRSTSPSLSGSSPSASICTSSSSRRGSLSSVEDLKVEARPARPRKKKVSFSGLPQIDIPKDNSWQAEPCIRPDSPTLGWEEDQLFFGQGVFSSEPRAAQSMTKSIEVGLPRTAQLPEQQRASSPVLLAPVPEENTTSDSFDLEFFIQTRSVNRMIAQLSALRSQIAWHRDNIDTLMTESDEIPGMPDTPTIPDMGGLPGLMHSSSSSSTSDVDEQLSPRTPGSAMSQQFNESFGSHSSLDFSARLATFMGHQDAWDRGRSGSVCSTASSVSWLPPRAASQMSMNSGNGDEALQKRIERLRANGWQRKRFDSKRYEALREQVLSELGA